MKIKLLASSAVLAGALMASGTASAAPVLEWSWQGTLQNWKDANYVGVPGLGLVSPVLGAIVDSNPPLPNTGTSCGAPCGDGDTTFTFISSDFALNSSVTLSEWEDDVTGQDYYRVNVQNGVGLGAVNSTLRYNISTTHGFFDWAELDTDHVAGTAQVTKKLFDTGSNPNQFVITPGTEFLTLTSNNGDPVSAKRAPKKRDENKE